MRGGCSVVMVEEQRDAERSQKRSYQEAQVIQQTLPLSNPSKTSQRLATTTKPRPGQTCGRKHRGPRHKVQARRAEQYNQVEFRGRGGGRAEGGRTEVERGRHRFIEMKQGQQDNNKSTVIQRREPIKRGQSKCSRKVAYHMREGQGWQGSTTEVSGKGESKPNKRTTQ